MPKWTNEQLAAINTSGTNIIVSAGAGSGKTAVLTERVITKLKTGIKINELLIITFTNAAASEMKERIRNKISNFIELHNNLDYLDSAYITTFDSFSLSLVKKYSYLLNVSPNLNIVDSNIITIYKNNLLDKIFDEFYLKDNSLFNKLIYDFTNKNDTLLKASILRLINSIELISDKEIFLNNYMNNYYSDEKINEYLKKYNDLLIKEINNIEVNLIYLSESDYSDYYEKMVNCLDKLIKSSSYNEIKSNINITLPRRPNNSEEITNYKNSIDESIKILKGYVRFNDEDEIIETLNMSKDYIKVIIDIIKRYYEEINKYKFENDYYEFTDIELLAIKLLKDNDYIRNEVSSSFKEILVDEYQDTNDLQEEFINLIANNNIYMVGDIKQSIYGFRNANPSIFKNKYDNYNINNGGIKIDLLKNFRSRSEVLDAINDIFSLIMDDYIGGTNYKDNNQMLFGNNMYLENKSENNNFEIYNYHYEHKLFSKEEIEAFIISKDIKDKINNKYQVIDKNTNKLRNCSYEDFCIIMDRGYAFPIYKKIFEYLGIPLSIYEDKKLTNEIDIKLISNIIELILKIKNNIIDLDFKYDFISILRSFLFSYNDNDIFEIIKENRFIDTPLYQICNNIANKLDLLNSCELLDIIINDFKFYEKLILIGNINDSIIRIDNLKDISRSLNDIGYSILDFSNYLINMINSNVEITYKGIDENNNAVKIMNIHKSKGLEFPICYYSGLYKEFNTIDIKTNFIYDKEYGFITPFFKEGLGSTILKDLCKDRYNIDNISEEIRLFYVALTRCKEKMIIVTSLDDNKSYTSHLVDFNIRTKYNSFLSIINSISGNLNKYIYNVNLDNYKLTKDYLKNKLKRELLNSNDNLKINHININIPNKIIAKKHVSKEINKLLTNDEIEKLEYGTLIHKILENTDFLNIPHNNYENILNNLKEKLNITSKTKIYKEHEFIYEDNDIIYHGIIDLVLIDQNIRIVDYKLKNIDDPKYIEQLKIYYKYLNNIYKKEIMIYLYSIIDNELKEIILN